MSLLLSSSGGGELTSVTPKIDLVYLDKLGTHDIFPPITNTDILCSFIFDEKNMMVWGPVYF